MARRKYLVVKWDGRSSDGTCMGTYTSRKVATKRAKQLTAKRLSKWQHTCWEPYTALVKVTFGYRAESMFSDEYYLVYDPARW